MKRGTKKPDADEVLAWLKKNGKRATITGMLRYGIPNDHAFGVSMGEMKKYAKQFDKDHTVAEELWKTGWYEARTLAAFIDEPERVAKRQMNTWAKDFDSWAIVDTVCFHLFDRTAHAWDVFPKWTSSKREFVRRAGFAMIWALSVHDKEATNALFRNALKIIESAEPDDRPLVRKAVDMALRAVGKRNKFLNRAAVATSKRLSKADDKWRSWIGNHALRELESDRIQARLR